MTSLHTAPPRHRHHVPAMRLTFVDAADAACGLDGETPAGEIGRRLAARGHDVVIHGRGPRAEWHRPASGARRIDTTGSAARSAARLLGRRSDVTILFDVASPASIGLARARGAAVAVQVDGVERDRADRSARRARLVQTLAVREADAVVTGSASLQDRYAEDFGLQTELIGYGATVLRHVPTDLLEDAGLVPGRFMVATVDDRAEHRVATLLEGYHRSDSHLPLVVAEVGDGAVHRATVDAVAARDGRIRVLQGISGRLLDQLLAHAAASLHGHDVGAADPSLLRAMGAGTAVLLPESVQNREVVGTAGSTFSSPAEATRRIEEVERYPFRFRDVGELMQERASTRHDWDVVAEQYEALAAKLQRGFSTRGMSSGRALVPVATEVGLV
jgi:glycosyltransferase involved in cell wall biosynthesis